MQHKEKVLCETSVKKWAPEEQLAIIRRKMDAQSEFVSEHSCVFVAFELFILSSYSTLNMKLIYVQKNRTRGFILFYIKKVWDVGLRKASESLNYF